MFQISKELVCQNEREEEITSEKDMVENCENEPKLNGKMKCKEMIDKIVEGEKSYQTAEELSRNMNESFKSVF